MIIVTCNIIIQIAFNTRAQAFINAWCLLSRVFFLKTSTLYAVTQEVTKLNNRKYQKKTSCISSQRTIMKLAKSEKVLKNYRFKLEFKINFLFNFPR